MEHGFPHPCSPPRGRGAGARFPAEALWKIRLGLPLQLSFRPRLPLPKPARRLGLARASSSPALFLPYRAALRGVALATPTSCCGAGAGRPERPGGRVACARETARPAEPGGGGGYPPLPCPLRVEGEGVLLENRSQAAEPSCGCLPAACQMGVALQKPWTAYSLPGV